MSQDDLLLAEERAIEGPEEGKPGHQSAVVLAVGGIGGEGVDVALGERAAEQTVTAPHSGVDVADRRRRLGGRRQPCGEVVSELAVIVVAQVRDGLDELGAADLSKRNRGEGQCL